ncbi:MAG: hypothetical protein AB1801_14305 [Chloroflexota bacterium]
MNDSRLGCFSLAVGGLLGLLLAVLFLVFLGQQAAAPAVTSPPAPAADVTLFLAEDTLSRLASAARRQPVEVDFKPNSQLEVVMPIRLLGLEPLVRLGLSLQRGESGAVSQLHWARLGLLKLPVDWLPAEALAAGPLLGDTITSQIPPDFTLVGLTTTADGLNFYLNWTPPPGP